eukprot:TRINITY_DN6870_c0_g2_i1.p1 TRINITY_DN6870_c0_g2~~TRINITY_DN6870_c0_g2_i1.p1  ORF type:complete len:528 (+),score=97.73 TRINITY_DN6870_c0_g2_i1:28-1611(+)
MDALLSKTKRYATTEITSSTDHLSENEKKALRLLIDAGKIMDIIFLKQKWSKNLDLYEQLKSDTTEIGKLKSKYFWINRSPWSILDEGEAFIEGVGPKPKGANYYPEDMQQEEFEKWASSLDEKQSQIVKGFFSVIRRDANKHLIHVPYNVEYKSELEKAAALLRQAAELITDQSLKDYLTKRSDAFLSNDYYDSDVAWLKIDPKSAIDVTIGPYEVYLDEMFSYKAAFESFIGLRDFEETQKLEKFSHLLQTVENNLPVDDKFKNPKLGAHSPIVVINEVFCSGDCAGPQTAAFNLPNDEKVISTQGAKLVLLKNVQAAKFEKILKPISDVVISQEQRKYISFDSFFTHILAHELSHSLGPHSIKIGGENTTVRAQLREYHSSLEEAKADILGLYALAFFIENGIIPAEQERSFYVTFLAGAFRSIRFGLEEAHGKGQAVQLVYLLEKGGFDFDSKTHTFSVNFDKIKDAVRDLTRDIILIQAEGSRQKAFDLLSKYGVKTPEVQKALDIIKDIPTDIYPIFPLAH